MTIGMGSSWEGLDFGWNADGSDFFLPPRAIASEFAMRTVGAERRVCTLVVGRAANLGSVMNRFEEIARALPGHSKSEPS